MKRIFAITLALLGTVGCGPSASDRLAAQRLDALRSVCEVEVNQTEVRLTRQLIEDEAFIKSNSTVVSYALTMTKEQEQKAHAKHVADCVTERLAR